MGTRTCAGRAPGDRGRGSLVLAATALRPRHSATPDGPARGRGLGGVAAELRPREAESAPGLRGGGATLARRWGRAAGGARGCWGPNGRHFVLCGLCWGPRGGVGGRPRPASLKDRASPRSGAIRREGPGHRAALRPQVAVVGRHRGAVAGTRSWGRPRGAPSCA